MHLPISFEHRPKFGPQIVNVPSEEQRLDIERPPVGSNTPENAQNGKTGR